MASGSFLKGDTKMLTEQRYQIILDLLKEEKCHSDRIERNLRNIRVYGKKRYYCTS